MGKKKTVMLYINCLHSPGGAERVFSQLAERFADCGWRSILVTSYREPGRVEYPLSERVERYNMEAERLFESRLKRNAHRIAHLRRLIRKCRPDLLITCMQEPNFRGMVASMGLPVRRMVSVCNATEKEYPGLMGKLVGRVLMPMAEGCVFQTEEEKRWFPARLQKKGRIIMNQVNESFFDVTRTGPRRGIVTVGKLRQGAFSPEASIDLHGLNVQQAFETLRGFFKASWYRGMRCVIVVPGRGRNSPDGIGILREKLKLWFTQEPFKRVVLAFCTARPHDGGPGSLYVLLRKYKKKGRVYWDRMPPDEELYYPRSRNG